MNAASTTHLVLIPSYNPGPLIYDTVRKVPDYNEDPVSRVYEDPM